ncbi:DUF6962 family protein [Aurantibacillus circumpalustris]|uniref:DUF6962 family protein n=1 Tax=Aurantibacillus circumpalustris TaxID=3036359 RepID=UPI00295C2782|nr:hypothetical protein [Aurantibacillus circumpalustris]
MNTLFFVLCAIYYGRLTKFKLPYSKQMALFMLLLGISSFFGGIGHTVQKQMGDGFFETILFVMNAFSILSIYFCFKSAYTIFNLDVRSSNKYVYFVMVWILLLLIYCGVQGSFLIIKIHAGIVLLYALIVHYLVYRRNKDKGSELVVLGILISFLPLIVHSLRISLHDWFNHKDMAHVIMIISLYVIYKGVFQISKVLSTEEQETEEQSAIKI